MRSRSAHLARCFGAVALALGVPGLFATACSTSNDEGASDGGVPDALLPARDAAPLLDAARPVTDASIPVKPEAGLDSGGDADADTAQPISCWATYYEIEAGADGALDGGVDADDTCVYVLPCGLQQSTITMAAVGCQVLPGLLDGAVDETSAATFPYCTMLPDQGCEDGGFVMPRDGGPIVYACVGCPGAGGRRPAGYRRRAGRGTTAAGAVLAELAILEAASVPAFEWLASELEGHAAPQALIDAARRSAKDERRHARTMGRLAARFGGRVPVMKISSTRRRPLAALARENAVEGCVRETYGALVNGWQAVHATDPAVRRAMGRIARDELRHAALSWEIQAWAESRLSPAERRSVERAKKRAIARLLAGDAPVQDSDALSLLGLPSPTHARALAQGLVDRLWSS